MSSSSDNGIVIGAVLVMCDFLSFLSFTLIVQCFIIIHLLMIFHSFIIFVIILSFIYYFCYDISLNFHLLIFFE